MTAQQTISQTDRLVSFGKIYGFLKYYHPHVAKGKFDWDKEFFKYLPKVIKATDKESLSSIYINWIESLGEIKKCKKCDLNDTFFDKNFDLDWLQDATIFNTELSSRLKYIEANRNQGDNYYASTHSAGNIKITNEPTYDNFEYPNEDYRLLGLFKYWNIIEYFYPYKYLTDQNWDAVLKEMIPKIRNATHKNAYQSTLKELIAKLDDSHAWIMFNERPKYKYLPVKITHVEDKAVIFKYYNDSLAIMNNLKLGDAILKINGKTIEAELAKNLKYVSGSNKNFKILKAFEKIFNGPEESLELTLEREGQIEQIIANKYEFSSFRYLENKRVITSKSITEAIGYINMSSRFTEKEFDNIFESFKTKSYIIVDLRGYPEFKYKMFTKYFNLEKRNFAIIYKPNISYPGKYITDKYLETGYSRKAFKGNFILLVNEDSLSLSEFTAMAFQTTANIITIGNQTTGADGDVVSFKYLGGFNTGISGIGVLYPDGSESQRTGVKIDIEVKPTRNGLKQGRDEILEKAIEIAKQ
ncbi:S41 family peptidase [Winogradskyella sediminis]|uniref:S41 family peptidase n=1 Tax=Winogradskyella sediminis TaxID=1382466 RepID=UPI003AA9D5DD